MFAICVSHFSHVMDVIMSSLLEKSSQSKRTYHTAKECKVCGDRSHCAESDDGSIAHCWNVSSPYTTSLGAFRHRLIDNFQTGFIPSSKESRPASVPRPTKKEHRYPFSVAILKSSLASSSLVRWSEKRCIPIANYQELGCTLTSRGLLIPERKPHEPTNICGYSERFWNPIFEEDSDKPRRFDFVGSRGYQYPDKSIDEKCLAVLIVEGFADVGSANAAGFYAIGRYTRGADLVPLAKILSGISKSIRIIVICENDEPKPGLETPRDQVARRANELSVAIDRPVLVCSPPTVHKDFNDWWIVETAKNGHLLSPSERRNVGQRIYTELLRAEEVNVIAANVQIAQEISSNLEIDANLYRSIRQPQNVDMDYDVSHSCTYRHIFKKSTEDGGVKFLGSKLACKSWKCSPCRKRLLIPNWSITLITAFSEELQAFTKCVPPADFEAVKKSLQRQKSRWAIVKLRADEESNEKSCLVISNKPIRGLCIFYDFFGVDAFRSFASVIRSNVSMADYSVTRPITTSHGISPSVRPERSDWIKKIFKILKSDQKIFAGMIEKKIASVIRIDAYKSATTVGRSKIECLTIDQQSGPTLVISTSSFDGDGLSLDELRAVVKKLIDDETSIVKATSCWKATVTRGWSRTGVNKGPSEVRKVANEHSLKCLDIDFGPLASTVDSASIRTTTSKADSLLLEIANA